MIDLIGEDEEIMFLGQFHDPVATFLWEGMSAGVVKARDEVKEFRTSNSQFLLERSGDESVFIRLERDHVQTMIRKNLEGEKVTGFLHEDRIPGLRKERAG